MSGLQYSLATLLVLGLASCDDGQASGPEDTKQKSVIFISIDTLRRDHVGFHGYERDTTPNLDKLAEESLVFDQAYTTMSWTLIAHMSMLTGLFPSQHGVWTEKSTLPKHMPLFPEKLRDKGYYTMGFHVPPWLNPHYGYFRAYDVYEPHNKIAEAEENWKKAMAERPKDKPFFLFIHLFDVHNASIDKADRGKMYVSTPEHDRFFVEDARDKIDTINVKQYWYEDPGDVPPEIHEAIVALYDSGIRHVDEVVGRWIEEWRAEGLLDDVVLVVTSDHGEGLRQRGGRYGGHGGTSEEGLGVPLMFRFPKGQFGGTRVKEPVSHVDIVPTLEEYLGLDPTPGLVGHSLLRGRPEGSVIYAERENLEIFIQYPWKIRQGRGKTTGFVWNLEKDPEERKPIRSKAKRKQFLELAEPVREAVIREQETWSFLGDEKALGPDLSAEDIERIKALGYAGLVEDDHDHENEEP